jgi:NAD(P)-dependent dehydrogenase (short-subunit alcohol dehydrogenase family)
MGEAEGSPFDLHGKAAVVTGGNSGIGFGMAWALAAAGAGVAIWGTNVAKNAAAFEALSAGGAKVIALRCDVGDEHQVRLAFEETVESFGRVDACFANAGVSPPTPARFEDLPLEQWRSLMRINLDGVFLTFQAAARHMIAAGGGSLIAISSIMGTHRVIDRSAPYAASKAGLTGLVRSAAFDLARHGIRVNAILPGFIETGMTDTMLSNERFAQRSLPRLLGRRWGTPDDLGGVAVYLASNASRYQTGSEIVIDGGFVVS